MLCGPAGCGKSTFAANHFLPTQIVSSDHCRALICDDPTNQQVTGQAFDLMRFIIEERLWLGRMTVADATHLKREDRRPVIKIARRFGFKRAAIVFNIPLELCIARNRARSRVVPEDALRAQYDLFINTLKTIYREGFDYVFALDENAQSEAVVKITRPVYPKNARSMR